jgi:hypothetical protein
MDNARDESRKANTFLNVKLPLLVPDFNKIVIFRQLSKIPQNQTS